MRTLIVSALTLSSFSFSAAVLAADHMKPGLWEMTVKSDAMKGIPKISSQQMEQMRRLGIHLPQMKDGGMVTKACISPEMAARDEAPVIAGKESGCETKNFRRSGSRYSLDLACDGLLKGEGKVKGSFSGGDSFTSTYDFKGTMQGRPVNQHQETSGKWLSADCGGVKPAEQLLPMK